MKKMIYELCPHCNTEVSVLWDTAVQGYLTKCPSCGERLLLCSECDHNTCDYDHVLDLCKKIVEAMWLDLTDIVLEIPDSGDEFLPEALTLYGITFPAGTTKTELWKWFDRHHPEGVAYLLYDFNLRNN